MQHDNDSDSESNYINGLNNGSIYKADLIHANELHSKIKDLDPTSIGEQCGCMSITAMTGAGKTILIKDLLSHNHGKYNKIYLISRTAKAQPIYDFIPRSNIRDNFDEEFLQKIYDSQSGARQRNNKKMPDPILIIMDDIINDEKYKKSKVINNLFTEGRHYNISVWFLTQNFTSLKQLQRNNVKWAVSFCHDTALERDKFSSAYLSTRNARTGRILFDKITKEKPYQCVVVEVYKVGVSPEEKIRKYTADPNVRKFKVKSVDDLPDKEANVVNTIKSTVGYL